MCVWILLFYIRLALTICLLNICLPQLNCSEEEKAINRFLKEKDDAGGNPPDFNVFNILGVRW